MQYYALNVLHCNNAGINFLEIMGKTLLKIRLELCFFVEKSNLSYLVNVLDNAGVFFKSRHNILGNYM